MEKEAAGPAAGFVYVQTNEPQRNRLVAFRRAGDGTLAPAGGYATGGTCWSRPRRVAT